MEAIGKAARNLLWIVLLCFASAAAVLMLQFLAGVERIGENVELITQDTGAAQASLMYEAEHILSNANAASAQALQFAQEERIALRKAADDSDKTVKATRIVLDRAGLMVKHTDEKLNGEVLPDFDRSFGTAAAKFGDSADALTAKLNDPAWSSLLRSWDHISQDLTFVADNSVKMSTDMQLAVHRIAAPPTFWHKVVDVSWTTAKFGSLFVP